MTDRPTNLEPAVGRLLVKPDAIHGGFLVWDIKEVEHWEDEIFLTVSDPMAPRKDTHQMIYKPAAGAWIASDMTTLKAYARLVGMRLR